MTTNIKKLNTIECLGQPRTSGDLWDSLNAETNPSSFFLNMRPNTTYQVRLLGPFVNVLRFYVYPFRLIMDKIDVEKIADKNENAIKEAHKVIDEIRSSQTNRSFKANMGIDAAAAKKHLNAIPSGMTWQKGIMVNAYIQSEQTIKILTLTSTLCNTIQSIARDPKTNISGIHARDLTIIKTGEALNTRFDIKLGKEGHLADAVVKRIISNGLIDISELLKSINGLKSNHAYYYRPTSSYRMPEEFNKCIFGDFKKKEEDAHINQAEEEINELPLDSFERHYSSNSIGGLEI